MDDPPVDSNEDFRAPSPLRRPFAKEISVASINSIFDEPGFTPD